MGSASPRSVSSWDDESTYGDDTKSPQSSFRTQNSSNPYPWEKEGASEYEQTPEGAVALDFSSSTPGTSRPPSYVSKKSNTTSLVSYSAPVCAFFGVFRRIFVVSQLTHFSFPGGSVTSVRFIPFFTVLFPYSSLLFLFTGLLTRCRPRAMASRHLRSSLRSRWTPHCWRCAHGCA